jgi:hypothetical protein
MIEPVTREIDGANYQVTQFLGEECFLHYAALVKIIGEPLAQGLLLAVKPPESEKEDSLSYLSSGIDREMEEYLPAVATAFATLADKLNPQEMLKLMKALLQKTRIIEDGQERVINFNLDFGGGRMKPLFKLFLFVLEVNFADFLPSGLDLATVVKSVAAEAANR